MYYKYNVKKDHGAIYTNVNIPKWGCKTATNYLQNLFLIITLVATTILTQRT